MKVSKTTLVTLLAGLASAACGGSDTLTGPSALLGGHWKLDSIQRPDFSVLAVRAPERYTAEFRDGGRLALQADCNRCSGGFQSTDGSLQVGQMACTKAYCGTASLDNEYLSVLAAADSFETRGKVLSVSGPRGVLRFTR